MLVKNDFYENPYLIIYLLILFSLLFIIYYLSKHTCG